MSQAPNTVDSASIKVSLPHFRFWAGLVIAAIITCSLKFFVPATPVRDMVAVFTAVIVCTTLYYHARNLRFNYEFNHEKLRSDKKIAAINVIGDWHKAENIRYTITARDFLLKLGNAKHDDIINELEKEENLLARIALVSVLNYLERVAIAAVYDAADQEILKDYFRVIFSFYAHKALPFIHARRKEKQDDGLFAIFLDINRKWSVATA
jgi:Domain of unknown function (DUF4760)